MEKNNILLQNGKKHQQKNETKKEKLQKCLKRSRKLKKMISESEEEEAFITVQQV